MNNKTNFANGLDHFCSACGMFFDVKLESAVEEDIRPLIAVCPICGNDELISSIDEFLEYLEDSDTDPIGFYKAFPPDEPIPNSCTGATPRQVAIILDLVIKRHDLPLTVENIAGNCETSQEIVRKVFDAFHITEKP